jgi:geranylgeranyl transferase type-2 subunit alpha
MMRENEKLDQDMLDLTAKLLMANPDIQTLWNIRKECILEMTKENK